MARHCDPCKPDLCLFAGGGSGGGGGGSSTLSGLTDVDISNPTDGQTLVYNAASGKWENGAGGGGNVFNIIGTFADETTTLDKTYAEIKNAYLDGATCIITTEVDNSDPEAIFRATMIASVAAVSMQESGTPGDVTTMYSIQDSTNTQYITTSPNGYPATDK